MKSQGELGDEVAYFLQEKKIYIYGVSFIVFVPVQTRVRRA